MTSSATETKKKSLLLPLCGVSVSFGTCLLYTVAALLFGINFVKKQQ